MATEFLMGIPTMDVPGAKEAPTVLTGGSNYVTHIDKTTKEDYLRYLSALEDAGFVRYADNGDGFGGTVFGCTFTRGSLVLHVTYFACEQRTSISFYDGPISEHLIYQDSYVADNKEDAKTKMHMLELFRLGNSFVFQLKNGHFVISDGGLAADLPYLLDYLESLVPEGEKPVIEAWFITHAHGDHCGSFCHFSKNTEWLKRVYVEGIYYSDPSEEEVLSRCGCEILTYEIKWVAHRLVDTKGNAPKIYRPQTGQRYYFNDITIDILLAQEQVPFGDFRRDLNTSSTVCLFTIEGQRAFFSGDIQEEGLEWIMCNYPKEFFDLDFFTLNHHGLNTCIEFAEHVKVKTVLSTVRDVVPIRRLRDIKCMISKAEESVVWGDGTKIFTFPYTPGTFETLALQKWIYNEGEERLPQANLYTCPGKLLQGWIIDADAVLLEGEHLKSGAEKLLCYLKENQALISAFSAKKTDEFVQMVKDLGVDSYFTLLLGSDMLDAEDPYLDAAQQSEDAFGLDHIYKYVVLCDNLEVVKAVIKDGFKSLVVTNGRDIEPELQLKCWHTFKSLDAIYDFIDYKKIHFK